MYETTHNMNDMRGAGNEKLTNKLTENVVNV